MAYFVFSLSLAVLPVSENILLFHLFLESFRFIDLHDTMTPKLSHMTLGSEQTGLGQLPSPATLAYPRKLMAPYSFAPTSIS